MACSPSATSVSDPGRVRACLDHVTRGLLDQLPDGEGWSGHLSSSALSTAVATIALSQLDQHSHPPVHASWIDRGLRWLADHANPDGGWGDTPESPSNLSTTALAWAAFGAASADTAFPATVQAARLWITRQIGSLDHLVPAIEERYGDDRTFSIPIVLTLALSGRLGPQGWQRVRPLPFELAALPRAWFGYLRLPVVSYALPALIALGQAIHHHAPSRHFLPRFLRRTAAPRTLQLLRLLQPPNGGFLEATPLTAFVTMSLASMGQTEFPVTRLAAEFLRQSVRPDGSWPIDTNLATWVTSLAIKALHHQPDRLPPETRARLRDLLLQQQYRLPHPYTGAPPGGWAWTHLPGGVPDADDTAGALLALHHLDPNHPETRAAAHRGIHWLLGLQNSDGGIPTFCRGWGRLPFDRSAPDLTAHALRAFHAWRPSLAAPLAHRVDIASRGALHHLLRTQRDDGAWVPLWFGNQAAAHQENPVHGTAHVLLGLADIASASAQQINTTAAALQRATQFLLRSQGPDGGWGGDAQSPPSIEETAWALTALPDQADTRNARARGLEWLVSRWEAHPHPPPSPVGLYFARLWYSEQLYPWIASAEALGRWKDL